MYTRPHCRVAEDAIAHRSATALSPGVNLAPRTQGAEILPVLQRLGVKPPPGLYDSGREVPSIWVNGALHRESSLWFRDRSAQVKCDTVINDAESLRWWIEHLHEAGKTVHTATHDDWLDFIRAKWKTVGAAGSDPEDHQPVLSDNQFVQIESAVRRFHFWLSKSIWKVPVPFRLKERTGYGGKPTERIEGGPQPRPPSARPTPLHPVLLQDFLDVLGRPGSMFEDRDRAFGRLLLASGIRRRATTVLTHYEIPGRATALDWDLVKVHQPLKTAKTRGYDSQAFTHLLESVWTYSEGTRRDLAEIGACGHHAPKAPLKIAVDEHGNARANDHEVWLIQSGRPVRHTWDRIGEAQRRQLVDVDGSSPFLFLNKDGRPLGYSTGYRIFTDARARAQAKYSGFPSRFRPHDLRHTYAMLLVLWWFFQNQFTVNTAGGASVQARAEAAVGMVAMSLGHADEHTTRLYTATAITWVSGGRNRVTPEMIEALR